MAQVLKPAHATMFTFAADGNLTGGSRPCTPPYTPQRSKIRFERTSSPAPSIHPTETVSPAKLQQHSAAQSPAKDNVIVRELNRHEEATLGYVELVYPAELEERSDGSGTDEYENESDVNESEGGIARNFARMHCADDAGEAEMRRARRARRNSKRSMQRIFKRTHSTSIKSDSEVTDLDAMDDHDLSRSARRLRRKVEDGETMVDAHLHSGQPSDMSAGEESPTRRLATTRPPRETIREPSHQQNASSAQSSAWKHRRTDAADDDDMQLSD